MISNLRNLHRHNYHLRNCHLRSYYYSILHLRNLLRQKANYYF